MEPIIITPKNEQEYSFVMEMLKKMKIKATPMHEKPRRMTMDEYNDMIDESLAAAREGRVISHSDLKEEMKRW